MIMSEKVIVEWAPFTLAEGISEPALLKASEALQEGFLRKQKGFLRRDLLKREGRQWVDVIHWASNEDASSAMQAVNESTSCQAYFQLMENIEAAEGDMVHFTKVRSWE
ncbi:hypothetical protein [Gimesia aquarii]|uniref:ABM domain-containing protein n=1 Tax=Gimesia aquarii TaxID=2527964 RepID=A0A517WXL4_9PLAN|nr:hypothetical protein [Gimesia aquarii]QDU10001.1 hypothetical protein V202x_33980 [Gimesia aquarii]